MIGTTLGAYRIIEQIGMGGMATVYKAFDPDTERYVAIKVLPQRYSTDSSFQERFRREAKAIANLQHPFILPMHVYGEQDGIAYMVMRYMDTGTLTDLLAQKRLPIDDINRLLSQLTGALHHAHVNGVIHRDVKPSNVLVDADGNAYLTDFGIAKIVEATQQLTASGGIIGTPQYMSPEQCRGIKDITPASDIYSLGIVLYQMLTGQVPFQAETPMAVIMQHLNDPLPPPRDLDANLPEEVERVVFKALAKEPEHRFESAASMSQAFSNAVASAPAEPAGLTYGTQKIRTVPQIDTRRAGRPRSRMPALAGLAVVLLISGVVAVALLTGLLAGAPDLSEDAAEEVTIQPAPVIVEPKPTVDESEGGQEHQTSVASTPAASAVVEEIAPSSDMAIGNIRFCDASCDALGAHEQSTFPEGTTEIFVSWDYRGMKPLVQYRRTWYNDGEFWLAYEDCVWKGPEDGLMEVILREPGGLRSGTWTMVLAIDGGAAVTASVQVEGTLDFWDPAGTLPCPDF